MRSKRRYYFLAVFILPLLFVFQNPIIRDPLQSFSLSVLKPVLETGHLIAEGLSETRDGLVHFWKAFQSQGELESRVVKLENDLRGLEEANKENARLKKLLEFRQTIPSKTIAARVIGWDPSPWRKTIILDKGRKHGIKKDMAIIVPEGLVGRVIAVGAFASRAILITDPDARVSAIADQSRAQGIVAGTGSEKLKMIYLEPDSGVAVEETVLTSGMGGLYPKGLRVGKISSIGKDMTGLQAQIESFVKFSKLEEVLCLASSREK